MSGDDPRQRFGDCAADYARGRPGYPPALRRFLVDQLGLGPGRVVAELGAGAGAFTALLLDTGCAVRAIEPSQPMLDQAARRLGDQPELTLLLGSAEATSLPDASVDLVFAAQAFHWFEPVATLAELRRITRPGAAVVLVWNSRRLDSPLMLALDDALRRHGERYDEIGHTGASRDAAVARFFAPVIPALVTFDNPHPLDAAAFAAYLGSISYLPRPGTPRHPAMLADLDALFTAHARDGRLVLAHDTVLFHAPAPAGAL